MAGIQAGDGEPHWSSKTAFVLAAIGSAVGLGNLWRFPYVAGENGGFAFVLVYLICVLLIGLPILSAELLMGRRGGGSAISAITRLAKTEGKTGAWAIFAWVGMLTSFLIVTFYSVIAGWVLYFAIEAFKDVISNVGANGVAGFSAPLFATMTNEEVTGRLGGLLEQPKTMIIFHALFIGLTMLICARGVKGGIEKAATTLMPAFFVLLLVLVGFSVTQGAGVDAAKYLFAPDVDKFVNALTSGTLVLDALGQAFFSIGLGSALMVTYGLYMRKSTNIPGVSGIVVSADTGVALIAGMAIFPIVFQFGLEPGAGPGLMFSTLPLAFHQIPFGGIFGFMFFAMALFAALTSSISLLEVAVAWADGDKDTPNKARRRVIGTIILGTICFIIGVGNALSQVPADSAGGNFFSTWKPAEIMPLFEGKTLLDFLDSLTGTILLPFGGLMAALFAGWVMSKSATREELGFKSESSYNAWYFLIRWVCPIAVTLVLIFGAVIAPAVAKNKAAAEAEQVDSSIEQVAN